MLRTLVAFTLLVATIPSTYGDEPKPKRTVELAGSLEDEALQKEMPANGVVVSQKVWDKLTKAWGITDAPKVDFTKEILVMGTWKGSSFSITPTVDSEGDLKITSFGTKDLRPGFRWKVLSLPRDGIKTTQGKALPKE